MIIWVYLFVCFLTEVLFKTRFESFDYIGLPPDSIAKLDNSIRVIKSNIYNYGDKYR